MKMTIIKDYLIKTGWATNSSSFSSRIQIEPLNNIYDLLPEKVRGVRSFGFILGTKKAKYNILKVYLEDALESGSEFLKRISNNDYEVENKEIFIEKHKERIIELEEDVKILEEEKMKCFFDEKLYKYFKERISSFDQEEIDDSFGDKNKTKSIYNDSEILVIGGDEYPLWRLLRETEDEIKKDFIFNEKNDEKLRMKIDKSLFRTIKQAKEILSIKEMDILKK